MITPEDLRRRLDTELAGLPVAPRQTAAERHARAGRRRHRRQLIYAGTSIALLATAAAVISLLLIGRPTSQAQVRPATPTVATPGDVDGDGIVDQVSLVGGTSSVGFRTGATLVVQSSKYGRLTLPLGQSLVRLTNQAGKPLADVDLFGTGSADIGLVTLAATANPTEFVRVLNGRLVFIKDPSGGPDSRFALADSDHGDYIETRWTCVSATGALNRPGFIQTYLASTNYPPTTWEIDIRRVRLAGPSVVPVGPGHTTYVPFRSLQAPGADAYNECGTGGDN
ncbi:MAG: hypothetical protein ACRDRL_23025 [Sciscionella sp.]